MRTAAHGPPSAFAGKPRYYPGMSRVVVAGLILAAVLAASASASTVPNVRGVLVIPRSAVCPPDEPCDPPRSTGSLVFSRFGNVAGVAS